MTAAPRGIRAVSHRSSRAEVPGGREGTLAADRTPGHPRPVTARRAHPVGLAALRFSAVLAAGLACALCVCVAHADAAVRDAATHARGGTEGSGHTAVPPSPTWQLDAGLRAADGGLTDASDARAFASVEPGPADGGYAVQPPPAARPAPVTIPPPGRLARVVLGLFALVALAIAAGHPRVGAFEKRAGLSMFAATGIPFLALGALARLPQIAIIDDDVVRSLRPLMEFGLGWIGFRVGSEFDLRELERLPQGAGRLAATQSAAAFAAASAGTIATLWLVGRPLASNIIRDGLILGACASVSGPSGARALEAVGAITAEGSRLVRKIVQLDDVVPIAVLALVSAIFRPVHGGNWRLPPLGWVFVQIGMGAALGALTVGLQRATRNVNEEVALTLGAVAFASGMASYLGFSPLAIGCVAGVVITNVTAGEENAEFVAKLRDLERPIFMVFFAVAGSLWDIRDWRGWVVIPLFVITRLIGKIGGARAGLVGEAVKRTRAAAAQPEVSNVHEGGAEKTSPEWPAAFPDVRRLGVALIPASAVSIAVVISATQSYGDIPAWVESVAIVGAIAAEVLFQFFLLAVPRAPRPPTVPPPAMTGGTS